jgi:hypothetical protein
MSAYVVDRVHIDMLVQSGLTICSPSSPLRWFDIDAVALRAQEATYKEHVRYLRYEDADRVGRMLWIENIKSVDYRYPDEPELPGPARFSALDAEDYTWTEPGYIPTPAEVLGIVACYDYQACEHPGWPASEAYQFIHALISECCRKLADDGSWNDWTRSFLDERRKNGPGMAGRSIMGMIR